MDPDIQKYVTERIEDQLSYFDSSAIRNKRAYKRLKGLSIACNVLTTMTIALAFTVPQDYKVAMGILALVLSTIVLATYQIEEFQSYGAKWEKFRLVAEQLKSERLMLENGVGPYSALSPEEAKRLLVERVEGVIRGTDISYFSLMVEPGRRIEKRVQQRQESD